GSIRPTWRQPRLDKRAKVCFNGGMTDQTTTPRWDRTSPWLRYLRSSVAVLTRTDRILADSNHIKVEIVDGDSPQPAPAWTDGTTISIVSSQRWRDIDTTEGRARLLGLNYHE